MPNVSASLSDQAYEIWKAQEGKKSPWISSLIVEGVTILAKNQALDLRVGNLQALVAELLLDLYVSRGGLEDQKWSEEQVLLWNKAVESLNDSIHRYHFQVKELDDAQVS